ncbi:MAG: isoprenylcysteine carboxylmethyltransferase family protein [Legionella sp.]|uniref:methyltransferase family protein n=1 Tax=Legionella sp. TaxID=459 RepID=UPI00283E8321|nr:isoprenylcysteine carboxylmethyltransferase family protein [Legionella sp.]
MNTRKTLLWGTIVLYFIIAFEVLIMISPFAGFFYSIFNPFLLKLAAHSSTRWLSAFYLPHMALPTDGLLVSIRIMGSIFFVIGMALFFICATQIYLAKLMKKGTVLAGIYSVIRHPQYLALGIAGIGLAILWPRMLTAVLWIVMIFVYYFLAKDEERRMLHTHRDTYEPFMKRTGMFFPRRIERLISPSSIVGKIVFGVGLSIIILSGAFFLRAYTVRHLTLCAESENVTAMAILPEDGFKMGHRMSTILSLPEVQNRIEGNKHYLVYFIPRDYIMQGMIADTGGDWKLFDQHRTIGMIAGWVFNPFGHLRDGHHAMHGSMHHDIGGTDPSLSRRLIFLSIEGVDVQSPSDLFSINALRVPQFMVDIDLHELHVLDVKDLPHGSSWGSVPTPVF